MHACVHTHMYIGKKRGERKRERKEVRGEKEGKDREGGKREAI